MSETKRRRAESERDEAWNAWRSHYETCSECKNADQSDQVTCENGRNLLDVAVDISLVVFEYDTGIREDGPADSIEEMRHQ